jgi:hypothetical protein
MNNIPTLETDALKVKWSGDPTATGYIEELEEKCSNFEFQCIGTQEFLRQTQELCHEYLNAKIKAERERNEALIELEEYRSIAENIGAEKAVSEKEKAIRERDAAIDAIMKIEDIFIDGDDTYEDWKSMGQIARAFLENTHESRTN